MGSYRLDQFGLHTPHQRGIGWESPIGGTDLVAADCRVRYFFKKAGWRIRGWYLIGDGTTMSAQLDIWAQSFATGYPTVAQTITASAKPSASSATKNSSTTLTGWTTRSTSDTIFAVKVDSVSGTEILDLYIDFGP